MYLIIGRTGSGKTYLANLLENHGFKRVVSRTTRPKRDRENSDAYVFLNKDEAKKQQDRVAQTKIGEYEYFTLQKDLNGKDMYIIDPIGMKDLAKNTPDIDYHVIYVQSKDDERKKHALIRENNKDQASSEFDKRNQAEDKQFTDFENLLKKAKDPSDESATNIAVYQDLPENIQAITIVANDYRPNSELEKYATRFEFDRNMHLRLAGMIKRATDLGITRLTPDNKISATMIDSKTGKKNETGLTPDIYADYLLSNNLAFDQFIALMLMHDDKLDQIYKEDE